MKRNLPTYLSTLILLATALRIWLVWDELPQRVASHFGARGEPNGFQDKQGFALLSLGIMAFVYVVLSFSPRLLRFMPSHLINIPNRSYWLTPERREAALDKLATHLGFIGVLTQLFMALTYELAIRANLLRKPLDNTSMFALLALLYASVITSIVLLYRDFRVPR